MLGCLCAPGSSAAPAGSRCPVPRAHLRRLAVGVSIVSWAPCVSLSPCPRVSCKCARESEFGCSWVSQVPALCSQSARPASAQSVPGGLCLSMCLSARPPVDPGDPRCSPVRLPQPRLLPRWLSRSQLALFLHSGFAEGGGVGGVQGRGEGRLLHSCGRGGI